jgi:hypothetical protein
MALCKGISPSVYFRGPESLKGTAVVSLNDLINAIEIWEHNLTVGWKILCAGRRDRWNMRPGDSIFKQPSLYLFPRMLKSEGRIFAEIGTKVTSS